MSRVAKKPVAVPASVEITESGKNAVYVVFGFVTLAVIALLDLLIKSDFTIEYDFDHDVQGHARISEGQIQFFGLVFISRKSVQQPSASAIIGFQSA